MANHKRPRTADHDPPPPTRKSSRVRTSTQQATLPLPSRAKSPGVRTSTRQAMSSRRSISAPGKSSIVPTSTETPSITTPGSHDASDAGNSHGSSYTLNSIAFVREALEIVNNVKSAELMILELMDKYSFDLPRLIELLRGKPSHALSVTLSHYWD